MEILSLVHNFVSPPPLSPHFQAGGVLEGYNEDLVFVVAFVVLLGILDVLIVRPFLHPKARYFALHFVANMICSVAAWPAVVRGLTEDPRTVYAGASHSMAANSVCIAIHLYHCIAFKLSAEDIFHHLTFVVVLGGCAIPFKWHGGIANNYGCFFLSGLPGGIDYFLLCLNYHNVVDRAFEKRWFTRINVWLRGPALVVYTFLAWCTWFHGNTQVATPIVVLIAGLHVYNGLHYLEQAVATGAIFEYRAKLQKMGVVIPDTKKKVE